MKLWFMWLMCLVFSPWVWGTTTSVGYIPPQAFTYKTTIAKELDTYFPELHERNYVPALIEHESCITLKHSRCWRSTAQLKSARELGVGLGQITKAYNSDGTVRFDSLEELRRRYKTDLAEVSWDNVALRADLQIRMISLMLKDSWYRLKDVRNLDQRLAFVDAAYNGGLGGVNKERKQCSLTKGCDYTQWFGHVEKHCLKSRKVLYGNRSACDINRDHVRLVIKKALPKYQMGYGL